MTPDRDLDARGLLCPLPVLRTRKLLHGDAGRRGAARCRRRSRSRASTCRISAARPGTSCSKPPRSTGSSITSSGAAPRARRARRSGTRLSVRRTTSRASWASAVPRSRSRREPVPARPGQARARGSAAWQASPRPLTARVAVLNFSISDASRNRALIREMNRIGLDPHRHAIARLDLGDVLALVVHQEVDDATGALTSTSRERRRTPSSSSWRRI
jgi:hypothetical protein